MGISTALSLWRQRKIRTSFQKLVSNKATTWWLKASLKVPTNFNKKKCLPVITWSKKLPSKQLKPLTYTLKKESFAAATLNFCESLLSDRVKQLVVCQV